MSADNEKKAPDQGLRPVSAESFYKRLPLKARVRLAFPRRAGGRVVESVVVGHDKASFVTLGLPEQPVEVGMLVQVSFAAGEHFFSFITRVLGVTPPSEKRPEPLIRLDIPSAWQRLQRREHFRLPLRIDVSARPIERPGETLAGESINISARGMHLALPEAFPAGGRLQLAFALKLPKQGRVEYSLQAEVKRRPKEAEDTAETRYLHGVEFIELSAKDEDELSQFMWEYMRTMKGRSLL